MTMDAATTLITILLIAANWSMEKRGERQALKQDTLLNPSYDKTMG